MPLHYLKNPEVVLREETEQGALLYNPDNNAIKILNGTGVFIWKMCDGKHDPESIAQAVQEQYTDVPAAEVVEQVKAFIEEMKAVELIGAVE